MTSFHQAFDLTRRYGLISWTALCLVTLLVYTFFHTGALLGEYVRPRAVGYIAAFGIEAGIIGMSVRIGQLLRDGRGASGWLSLIWQGVTLLFVLGVSAMANVAEGFAVKYGEDFTLAAVNRLDEMQIVVGLLATALIPVVVLSMSEIVSGEVKEAVKQHEKDLARVRKAYALRSTPKVSNTVELDSSVYGSLDNASGTLERARQAKAVQDAMDQEAREQYIYTLIKEGVDNPNWSEVSRELNVSRTTVYNDRDRMVQQDIIREVDGRWIAVNGFHTVDRGLIAGGLS